MTAPNPSSLRILDLFFPLFQGITAIMAMHNDLKAQLQEALKVIEPFAKLAKQYDDRVYPDDKPSQMVGVRLGDLRAARIFVDQSKESGLSSMTAAAEPKAEAKWPKKRES